jgi:hypothetical protein
MFGQRGQWRQWIETLVQKFRDKGATSPEKAMTAQELGLGEMFEGAMKRRLGQTGIFVEAGGKYYLNEERLREFQQRRQGAGAGYGGMARQRSSMFGLRIIGMILGVVIILLVLVNLLSGRSLELSYVIVVLAVIWIGVWILQIAYFAQRNRF